MARQWRIEYPGALYHVLSRGNNGQNIFISDHDRRVFLDLMEDLTERFSIEIYAYVLMGNHYHILLKTKESNLSKSMQWFGTIYTRRFNIKNGRIGHLFQGRFKSIIVENDACLFRLSCYIHRNPLRAGFVKRLSDYRWSSYRFYAYGNKTPNWLKTELILDLLPREDPFTEYRRKVQYYSKERKNIWEDIQHGLIYGSQGFTESIKEKFLSDKKEVELPQHNSMFADSEPEIILLKASRILAFDPTCLYQSKRLPPEEKEKRDCIIYLLWESGRFSNQKIASLVGLTYSSISKQVSLFRSRLSDDGDLREKYKSLNSQFKV